MRQILLERSNDVFVSIGVRLENFGVKCAITCVVHSKHGGHHRRLVGEDVPFQSQINISASAAGDSVTTPAGVNELKLDLRKTRDGISFNERRVKALIGNAVAVEYNAITLLEVKTG